MTNNNFFLTFVSTKSIEKVTRINQKVNKEKMLCIYRKIPKISAGAYIFQRPFLRGLYTEGNLRFKTDWACRIVGRKFTVFACFYFVFEGNFPSTSPRGAYIWRGDLTEGFLRYRFGGLVHGGAYFRNFTVSNKYFSLD